MTREELEEAVLRPHRALRFIKQRDPLALQAGVPHDFSPCSLGAQESRRSTSYHLRIVPGGRFFIGLTHPYQPHQSLVAWDVSCVRRQPFQAIDLPPNRIGMPWMMMGVVLDDEHSRVRVVLQYVGRATHPTMG